MNPNSRIEATICSTWRGECVRARNEAAERPVSDAEWAFGDRLGRVIHGCNLIERSNNIKHIRLGWTCHANRASMGSSPGPGSPR